jgi:hypothetical protein
VLIWNTMPTVSGTPADIVLGQTDFVTETGDTSSTKMKGPRSVAWHGANLWVADSGNHRVLMFANPRTSGAAATRVLGQTNFTSGSSRSAASFGTQGMSSPTGVCIYSGKLLVVDQAHHRVLIWNKVPTASNTAASVVVGQSTTTASSTGLTSTTLNTPTACCVTSAGYLMVADTGNNRALIYSNVPAANGAAAATVLGQVDFTSNATASTATGMNGPAGVAENSTGELAVADTGNNRVMLWYAMPGASGAACHAVLGQANFTSNSAATSSGAVMSAPEGLCWSGTSLLVSGEGMKRTMKFSPA